MKYKKEQIIRLAKASDASELNKLIINNINHIHKENYTIKELDIWRRGYTINKIKHQIKSRLVYILEIKNQICATIQYENPEIKGFYINPNFIGQGVGKWLLKYTLNELKNKGYKKIELTSNEFTIDFYKKLDFTLQQKETVYWENHPFTEFRMIYKNNNDLFNKISKYH